MITNLTYSASSNGQYIEFRGNLDHTYDDTDRAIYIFKKEGSALTAQEKADCKAFIDGTGGLPSGLVSHKWFWHDDDGDNMEVRFGSGGQSYNKALFFRDYQVEAGQIYKSESYTSGNTTTVTVKHSIISIIGVWERSDIYKNGLNYYTGGSVSGKVITLGSALPAASTEVWVEYIGQYDDAVEYHYFLSGRDDLGNWVGDTAINSYAAYNQPYVMPNVLNWIKTAIRKVLAAKDYKAIDVRLEYPHDQEQHPLVYISLGGIQEIDPHWSDKVALPTSDGRATGRASMMNVKVEWFTADHALTRALSLILQSSTPLIHDHIIMQKGYYSAYSPKFSFGDEMVVPTQAQDKLLYLGTANISISVITSVEAPNKWQAVTTMTATNTITVD